MDIISPFAYIQSMKRRWRRRKYQKLEDKTRMKRKLKIVLLGNKKQQNGLKIKNVKNGGSMLSSPLKMIRKFHEAYVDGMTRLEGEKRSGRFKAKRVPTGGPVPVLLSASTVEVADGRMLLQIYKKMVSFSDNLQQSLGPLKSETTMQ